MAFTPLNALNSFIAVATHRSYARAAKELGVSTSALSQSVRQLEARVGIALLVRTSRSVSLTEAGERLLANAGPAVNQALDALKAVKARRGEVTGRVRLSVPAVAVQLVLAPVIPSFVQRYPKVELDIRVEDRFVNIVTEGLDAGIRLFEAIDRDMVQVRLSPADRLVVAAAPSYLERRGAPLKPPDLLDHECICTRWNATGEPWAWELERGKKTWRVPVRGSVITNNFELKRHLALSGVGLLYSLQSSIEKELARGRLRLVLEPYASEVPGLFLYYPSRAQMSPAVNAFVEHARATTKINLRQR